MCRVGHVYTAYLLCNPICYNIFAGDKDGLITAYSFMDDTHLGMYIVVTVMRGEQRRVGRGMEGSVVVQRCSLFRVRFS